MWKPHFFVFLLWINIMVVARKSEEITKQGLLCALQELIRGVLPGRPPTCEMFTSALIVVRLQMHSSTKQTSQIVSYQVFFLQQCSVHVSTIVGEWPYRLLNILKLTHGKGITESLLIPDFIQLRDLRPLRRSVLALKLGSPGFYFSSLEVSPCDYPSVTNLFN